MAEANADERGQMPRPRELADAAQARALETHGPSVFDRDQLRSTFDDVILALMDTEYELYQEAEREIKVPLLAEVLTKHSGDPERTADPRALADDLFADLDKFFVSLGNSRKSRAGGSFERHLAFLLKRLGLPFEEKQVINGEPDFLLPNADLYLSNPADVILMTAKRTLRERWRQVIIEGIKTSRHVPITRRSTPRRNGVASNRCCGPSAPR